MYCKSILSWSMIRLLHQIILHNSSLLEAIMAIDKIRDEKLKCDINRTQHYQHHYQTKLTKQDETS